MISLTRPSSTLTFFFFLFSSRIILGEGRGRPGDEATSEHRQDYGVSVEDIPYYLVFEYMDKGDLAQFLHSNASSLQRRVMNPFDGRPRSTMSDEPPTLPVEQLTDICKQIAGGGG